ncbi:MAG: hypothetical protein AAB668_01850 [Patescibacteria group bacterium]
MRFESGFKPASSKEALLQEGLERLRYWLERAEKGKEAWQEMMNALLSDLAEVESLEGKLDPDDVRLTSIKIIAMRLDEIANIERELRELEKEMIHPHDVN